eukprot:29339-Pelagococcus_subviridis.AAC.10
MSLIALRSTPHSRTFSGFKSQCTTPCDRRYASADTSCFVNFRISPKDTPWNFVDCRTLYSECDKSSKTRHRYAGNAASDDAPFSPPSSLSTLPTCVNESNRETTHGCPTFFPSPSPRPPPPPPRTRNTSISRFACESKSCPFFMIFIATRTSFTMSYATMTNPNAPRPTTRPTTYRSCKISRGSVGPFQPTLVDVVSSSALRNALGGDGDIDLGLPPDPEVLPERPSTDRRNAAEPPPPPRESALLSVLRVSKYFRLIPVRRRAAGGLEGGGSAAASVAAASERDRTNDWKRKDRPGRVGVFSPASADLVGNGSGSSRARVDASPSQPPAHLKVAHARVSPSDAALERRRAFLARTPGRRPHARVPRSSRAGTLVDVVRLRERARGRVHGVRRWARRRGGLSLFPVARGRQRILPHRLQRRRRRRRRRVHLVASRTATTTRMLQKKCGYETRAAVARAIARGGSTRAYRDVARYCTRARDTAISRARDSRASSYDAGALAKEKAASPFSRVQF